MTRGLTIKGYWFLMALIESVTRGQSQGQSIPLASSVTGVLWPGPCTGPVISINKNNKHNILSSSIFLCKLKMLKNNSVCGSGLVARRLLR